MSEARERWLNEGVRVLMDDGFNGIRIDRLAARLGLSKGSFHHHFAGAVDYKRVLLGRIEQLSLEALEIAVNSAPKTDTARDVLRRLTDAVGTPAAGLYRPEMDAAVRAWALSDADARATLARIDEARLAALEKVWRTYVRTDAEARIAALVPYLLSVGAAVTSPPVSGSELKAVFELILPLVPEVPGE
ncbi:TetR/AcrR family transcriptional regulator [Mycetocola zhujimingii]|uniref:TetR/AcrR family transcriptional regulator n=1 Tax=Mycetocola zhujimingii TaxID=2079792 RepID=UPI000D347A95|nr:TetR/AcrR family transcriptional regulator [Mycetocola zhujimingii]AWB86728.1 hypothetical protein C3E77_08920 [Mycetocola zhujimingii]